MSSDDLAISVRGVGKSYRITHKSTRDTSFAEILTRRLRYPFGNGSEETETFWALNDVSFDVRKGEVLGIIGRNGAGKSTLLKILSRITSPTAGEIDIHGRVASLLEVGTGFHPELTGRENVFLNGAILGMSRREIAAKFDEIVAFAEVEKFLDTPVKRYSSGMFVRLAFAVAAHLEPEILIVDEVLAVGDFAFQKKCLGKMHDVAADGRTILFVSHSMPTIIQLCERAIHLEKGNVIDDGPAEKVANAYFVKGQADQPGTVRLADMQRESDVNGRAQFVSCRLTSPDKVGPWSFPFGSHLVLELEVVVNQPIPRLEFGMAVCTNMGNEFASVMGSDSQTPEAIENGKYIFKITLPNLTFNQGRYMLDLGLRSDRGMEDYIREALHFEVLPTQEAGRIQAHHRRGAVIPDVTFSIRKLDFGKPSPSEMIHAYTGEIID